MEAPDARAVIERLHQDAYFPIHVPPHAERQGWLRLPVVGPRAPARPAGPHPAAGHPLRGRPAPGPRARDPRGARAQRPPERDHDRPPAQRPGRRARSATRSPSIIPARSRASTSTWCGPARRAGSWRSPCAASPNFWKRGPPSRKPSSRPSPTRLVITAVGAGAIVFLLTFVIPRFAIDLRRPRAGHSPADPDPPGAERHRAATSGGSARSPSSAAVLGWRMWTGRPRGVCSGTARCCACPTSARLR